MNKCPLPNEFEFSNMFFENEAGEIFNLDFKKGEPDYPPESFKPITCTVCFPRECTEKVYLVNKSGHYGSGDVIASGGSSYPASLVLAMTRPSFKERLKSLFRTKKWLATVDFEQAVRHAGRCERCMNSLAWLYGLDWGYPPFKEEWEKSRTLCIVCKPTPSL